MSKRLAFYVDKSEIEKLFNIQLNQNALFEPNYNITPGHHIPVVFLSNEEPEIKRIRWGDKPGKVESVFVDDLSAFENKNSKRVIIPISGFYVWKDGVEDGFPFFARLTNNEPLYIAGLMYNDEYFELITVESNILIQPMTETMPLMLDKSQSNEWLSENLTGSQIKRGSENRLLTDFSVTRVSKKVNDPTNNTAQLIQPIPK